LEIPLAIAILVLVVWVLLIAGAFSILRFLAELIHRIGGT
jgi:hypothetical protein